MERLNLSGDSFDFKKFINVHRVAILETYLDREFVHNPKYLIKQMDSYNGNIHNEMYTSLYKEFLVVKGNKGIDEMVDRKVLEIIKRLYV